MTIIRRSRAACPSTHTPDKPAHFQAARSCRLHAHNQRRKRFRRDVRRHFQAPAAAKCHLNRRRTPRGVTRASHLRARACFIHDIDRDQISLQAKSRKGFAPIPDLRWKNVMTTCHLSDAGTGPVRLRQNPQLRIVRPTPVTFNARDKLHPRHCKTLHLELMPALMPTLIPDHQPTCRREKMRLPDGHRHCSTFSGLGASDKPGAVQSVLAHHVHRNARVGA